ncbi:virulence factor family protein [Acuticoccus sediminis]|uniref:virulence factor family protein n=1 Tax=Acuticoccus sediminis TaxID=2184697 RepID=UPI001CFC8102|nr:AcvB/VirJ family lysyl-phosphatidylglycerol hydrolase [Acuticoccus sediminis]
MTRAAAAAAVLLAVTSAPAQAAPRTTTVATAHIGDITVLAPESQPETFAVLVSDADGTTDAVRAQAEALVAKGTAVALVDLPGLMALKEAQDGDGCHYVFGDFEELSRLAERQLGMTTWRWPVVIGLGSEGGTMAYLALAQAPENTAAGAVSLGFSPVLAARRPLCPGAAATPRDGGGFDLAPPRHLPGPWTLILPDAPAPDVAPFVAAGGNAVRAVGAEMAGAAADAVLAMAAGPADPLADLPLTELPAEDPVALAIFISGDGGWRDLDKTIGEWLAAHGVAVVGVDALRYFWSERSPEEIANAIERIAAHYGRAWGVEKVALLGYSFGADVLPLAWPKLDEATRDRTVLVGLLGLAHSTTLEVTISGWLGLSSGAEIPLAGPLAALPADRVVCVYGTQEAADDDTGCTLSGLREATLIERPGGHHFDGDYAALATMLRARLAEALAAPAQARSGGAAPR